MNKEERLKDYLEGYNSQYLFINEDRIEHTLEKDIKDMLEENKQLKERIDKAIEYIEKRYNYEDNVLIHTFDKDNIKELYEILKGVNDD